MAGITQTVAGLYHFINGLSLGIVKHYFGEIPESFAVPSVYYPEEETNYNGWSTNTYEADSVIYLKVFGKDSTESDYIARQITEGIMQAERNIPLYDSEGVATGISFRINNVAKRKLEFGVTQIQISYKTHEGYSQRPVYPKADYIYWEGLTTNIEEEDDGSEQQEQQSEAE